MAKKPQITGYGIDYIILYSASVFFPALADQSLLRDRRHQRSIARKYQAARQSARTRCVRGVLGIEQPLVGAEGTVKPQRMVEARGLNRFLEDGAAVRNEGGVEQRHVGGIGEHALVDRRIV